MGGRAAGLFDFARTLPSYLAAPLRLEQALEAVKSRFVLRDRRFLDLAERAIYSHASSIYRRLLLHAGCELGDLHASVTRYGLEQTLASLRDEGVYLTLEEFKGAAQVCRNGSIFDTDDSSLTNPLLTATQMKARTSGSRHPATAVGYTLKFFEEEAQEERILFASHGLDQAMLAYWMPGPPGIAGIHNLLINLKSGPAPHRWFSQVEPCTRSIRDGLALRYISCCALMAGRRAVMPRFMPMDRAGVVARWMRREPGDKGPRVLKAYASSAMRVVQAALDDGIELTGQVMFTGGEPLTAARHSFLASAGIRAYPRYVATEAGLIAAACGQCAGDHDRMHVYLDRLAVIQMSSNFLFTSLSPHTPRILLNAELGDQGRLTQQPCECLFGALGLTTFVSGVGSPEKLTGEGVTLLHLELKNVLNQLVHEFNGSPDDYQFWESSDGTALNRVVVAVSPRLEGFDESRFKERLLDNLRRTGAGGALTAQMWQQAETLRIVRAHPKPSAGHKILPIITQSPDDLP